MIVQGKESAIYPEREISLCRWEQVKVANSTGWIQDFVGITLQVKCTSIYFCTEAGLYNCSLEFMAENSSLAVKNGGKAVSHSYFCSV